MEIFSDFSEAYKYMIKNVPSESYIQWEKDDTIENRFLDTIPIFNIGGINYIKVIHKEAPSIRSLTSKTKEKEKYKYFILEKRNIEIDEIDSFFLNKLLGHIHKNDKNIIEVSFDLDTLIGLDGLIESNYPFLMMNSSMFNIILKHPEDFHDVSVIRNLNKIIFGNYCHTPIYINNFIENNVIIGGAFDDIVIGLWEDSIVQVEKDDNSYLKELLYLNEWSSCLNMDIYVMGNNVYKFNVTQNKYLK